MAGGPSRVDTFDLKEGPWTPPALASRVGLERSIWPRVYESSEITGTVSRHAAALTGLAEGTPVVAGAGDQAASAVGNGIVAPGIISCTIGTSGVVFAHTQSPAYDPPGRVHTFCHAVKGEPRFASSMPGSINLLPPPRAD